MRNYKPFELISLEALQSPNESASGCKQYPTQGPDCYDMGALDPISIEKYVVHV